MRLLDSGSFHEVGALTGVARYGEDGEIAEFTPANLVTGRGRIDERPVIVAGDDFTVRGGANDAGIKAKLMLVERMARDLRRPLIRLVDGTGGGGSVKNLEMLGYSPMPKAFLWDTWTNNLSEVGQSLLYFKSDEFCVRLIIKQFQPPVHCLQTSLQAQLMPQVGSYY